MWAPIAVHTSPHVAERLSSPDATVGLGARADFGEDVIDPALRRATEAEHPRLDAERVLSEVVVAQAVQDGRRAPASSWTAALLAAHRAPPDPDARLSAF